MIVDPRKGDIDDDASSTKSHSLWSLAGTLFAEVSLPKLLFAWIALIAFPAAVMGAAPILLTIWTASISSAASYLLTGLLPALLLVLLVAVGWYGRRLFRLAESSFWSLNALAIQPLYMLVREGLRHGLEKASPSSFTDRARDSTRAISAALAGILIALLALWIVLAAWPSTRWIGNLSDLASPVRLVWSAFHNSIVLVGGYLAIAALIWGWADATMGQPHDLPSFHAGATRRRWRIAHLSDLHIVGERYGFRIECGRAGPQGNERVRQLFARLAQIHEADPLDAILITGDATDAGLSSEWSEFSDILSSYPALSEKILLLPGNHDLNVVDRTNPARLDLPTSPRKRLRQIRMISALEAVQGSRVHVSDAAGRKLGATLADALKSSIVDIKSFADRGSIKLSWRLARLWEDCFPLIVPPGDDEGLGVILLNSNAETHFSFTNALGIVPVESAKAIDLVTSLYPRSFWIVALHHHAVEYPKPTKALSERVGTALVNGNWFVRKLRALNGRIVVMHGHRHVDWIGECSGIPIVSAPSPVMEATNDMQTSFLVHTLAVTPEGRLALMEPTRIVLPALLL